MRRTPFALSALLIACRAAPTPAPVTAPPPGSLPAGEAPAASAPLARELPFAEVPRCEASDAITLARSTLGLPATPAVARGAGGGMVAYVAIPEGERAPKILLTSLDAQGSPAGAAQVALLDAGESPALPALAAEGDGFVLAWRSGPAGRQQVRLRRLDARGVPAGEARAVGSPGSVGAITLRVVEGRAVVAYPFRASAGVATANETPWAASVEVHIGDRRVSVEAPPGGAFTGEAPRVTGAAVDALRVWALTARAGGAASDEHALVTRSLRDGDTLHLVARDLDHVDAHALPRGTLVTWRARVARRDVALRAAVIGDDGTSEAAPVTLATFGGAAELRGAIVPLGANLVAALSLATLSDDANGSVNLAVTNLDGTPLGRAPALTSLLARSTAVAVAPAPEGTTDGLAWAVIDGRDSSDGRPTLLLTRFGCDPARAVARLDVHPGTWVQSLAAPEAAPVQIPRLEGTPAAMSCETRATRPWVAHASGNENDALAGTRAAVALTATGAQLWAVARTPEGRTRLVTSTLDARGVLSPPRVLREGDAPLPPAARPAESLVPAARVRAGDTVLDATREGNTVLALLARPDPVSDDVAQTVFLDRGGAGDPAADPLGHPRGRVFFAPSARPDAGARAVVFNDRGTLRRSEIVDGVLRDPRSLMEAYPGGGELLGAAGDGARRWVVLASGDPGDGRNVGAITLAAVEASGVRGVTRLFPEDGSVIPLGVSVAAQGDRVVIVFPRSEQGGTVTWTWADLRCTVPGGAR